MKTIDQISRAAHINSVDKGFYDQPRAILETMKIRGFSADDIKAVKDAFVGQRLMLIVSEIGEALEANRNNKEADLEQLQIVTQQQPHPDNFPGNFKDTVKDSFADELADAVIRIGDLAGWLGISLGTHVELKHKYNTTRQKLHGKKY